MRNGKLGAVQAEQQFLGSAAIHRQLIHVGAESIAAAKPELLHLSLADAAVQGSRRAN